MSTRAEENRQVVNLNQALLGAISPNFRAVAIRCQDAIVLTFLLEEDAAEDREEIEEVALAFEALQSGPVSVSTEILVSTKPLADITLAGRLVYYRREP
jgi:hypothetical protein